MPEIKTRFCGDTALHGWHHWYREGDGVSEEDLVKVRCDGLEKMFCPDGGACHHMCGYEGYTKGCFRVVFAGPLSGVYPGNKWPQSVIEEYGDQAGSESARSVIAAILEDTDRVRDDLRANAGHDRMCPWTPALRMCYCDFIARIRDDILERAEALARKTEAEAEKEGRGNPTLRTIKLVRAQGMRDVIKELEKP